MKGLHLYSGQCYSHCPDSTYGSEVTAERSSRRRILESTLAKRQDGKPSALEAQDMQVALDAAPRTCLPCHYTCSKCSGSDDSQCLTCPEDAQLINLTVTESKLYCYPNSVVAHLSDDTWHYSIYVGLSVFLFAVSFVSLYFFVSCIFKRYCCGGHYKSNLGAYNKLAVDDNQQSAVEVEEEICKALKDDSESESDDDLNL